MTKRVFRSIFSVAMLVLIASSFIILAMLYNNFNQIQKEQLYTETRLIVQGVNQNGEDYFTGLKTYQYRITWVDPKGTVLFDTNQDIQFMDNHADREEIQEAQQSGFGEATRFSETILKKMHYTAQRLSDGSVIRVSHEQPTILAYFLMAAQPMLIILLLTIGLSALLASRISKEVVKPLNQLNLDDPLSNDTYEELSPLLTRMEEQHRQINQQLELLQRKQDEFSAITEYMNEGLVILNEKGSILSINQSAAKLFKTDLSCIGHDMLTVDRSLPMQRLLVQAFSGKHAESILLYEKGDFQIIASPVFNSGKAVGIVLLTVDISEKVLREKLRREFTANVSHELKTPLQSISGSAEILQNGLVLEEDKPRFISQIYRESQRLIALVDDIIHLSRLDEGIEEVPREPIQLFTLSKEVLSSLQPAAQKKDLRMSIHGEEAMILGLAPQIRELVYNLCDNAIKYNKEGGSVDVFVQTNAESVVLQVADTGIGIPEEHHSRIFERFYCVDKSHSKETGGTGLGLSIVKHAAQIHGATIELQSRVGIGTTITLRFPRLKS